MIKVKKTRKKKLYRPFKSIILVAQIRGGSFKSSSGVSPLLVWNIKNREEKECNCRWPVPLSRTGKTV